MRRAGLISRRRMLGAALHQLGFTVRGASHQQLHGIAAEGVRAVAGLEATTLDRVVDEAFDSVLRPRLFVDALALVDAHHRAEEPVFLVSSAPEGIVARLGRLLGATDYAGTSAEVAGDGRYTGRLRELIHGPTKYHVMHELAQRHGIDLARSVAYADGFSDAQMLGATGRAVCINPDRRLRELARRRGWEVRHFHRTAGDQPLADVPRTSSTSRR
jgi:HAD superfamily hydrolase (TIGR01490 family)